MGRCYRAFSTMRVRLMAGFRRWSDLVRHARCLRAPEARKQRDNRVVLGVPCGFDCIPAVDIPSGSIGTCLKKQLAYFGVSAHRCQDQRSAPLSVPSIQGCTTLQMERHCGGNTRCERQPEKGAERDLIAQAVCSGRVLSIVESILASMNAGYKRGDARNPGSR